METGPSLHAIIDKKIAAQEFAYSGALKSKQGQNWNSANLDKWLSKPAGFVPGNKMGFAGLDGRKDRNDLITFLGTVWVISE